MIDSILAIASQVAWLLFATLVIILFVRTTMRAGIGAAFGQLFSYRVILPFISALSIGLLSAALIFVEPQEVAVIVSALAPRGVRPEPLPSGVHWLVPLMESAVRYPIYWQTYTMSSKPLEGAVIGDDSIRARTSDGQEVTLDCSIIFRIDNIRVVQLHIEWQNRYTGDLLRPIVRGIVRTQVSQFTVEEVNSSERKDLEINLDRLLRESLSERGLILDQFLLRDIAFTEEYAHSIEQKQVALQIQIQREYEANQMRNLAKGRADQIRLEAEGEAQATVLRAQARAEQLKLEASGEAEATVVRAEAQAKALKMIAAALENNPDLLTYQYIDKLSPQVQAMFLPNNAPFIFPLPTLAVNPTLPVTPTVLATRTATPAARTTPIVLPTVQATPTPVR